MKRHWLIFILILLVAAGVSSSGLAALDPPGQVEEVQRALQKKGFDSGPIDGRMGPKTRAALREFQRAEGLAVSGEVDEKTAAVLGVKLDVSRSKTTYTPRMKDVEDQVERAREAADVLEAILTAPDKGIPQDLLSKAHAVAVIPHAVKGAFIVGGSYGEGLIAHRDENGQWSAPAFIDLGGASVGFQIGASATDYVLVFTNEDGLKPLLKGKVKLGADVSVAAGPVGRTASASTDVTLNSEIYSYSRTKGAFAGVALDGAAIGMDDSANQKVYSGDFSGEDILLRKKVSANEVTRPFVQALDKYVPPHQH